LAKQYWLILCYSLLIAILVTLPLTFQQELPQMVHKSLLKVNLKEELRTNTDLKMLNWSQFVSLMILTCQEKIPLVLNHLSSLWGNGLTMNSGMIELRFNQTIFRTYSSYQLWANQVVVELRFQTELSQSSILLTIPSQLLPIWLTSLSKSLLSNSSCLMKKLGTFHHSWLKLLLLYSILQENNSYQHQPKVITFSTWEMQARYSKVYIKLIHTSMKTRNQLSSYGLMKFWECSMIDLSQLMTERNSRV